MKNTTTYRIRQYQDNLISWNELVKLAAKNGDRIYRGFGRKVYIEE